MFIIKADNSPFGFFLKEGHHSHEFIKRCIGKCLNLTPNEVEINFINGELIENVKEDAIVYLDIQHKPIGFLTYIEVGIVRYKRLSMEVNVFVSCLYKMFNDDVLTILNDDTCLLVRNSNLYTARFESKFINDDECVLLNEKSITRLFLG